MRNGDQTVANRDIGCPGGSDFMGLLAKLSPR